MRATLLLHNGTIHALDRQGTRASAVAVADERIVAVGDEGDLLALVDEGTTVVDLGGRSVFPGFIDAHTHWEVTAHIRKLWVDATLESPERVLDVLRAEVARSEPGEWIVIASGFLAPLPGKAALDEIAPDNPVVVRRTMHVQVANSLAFTMSGLVPENPQPMPGCRLEVDELGAFTGLVEDSFDLFAVSEPSEEVLRQAFLDTAQDLFLANGITTIHDMPASVQGSRMLQHLRRDGDLPLRVVLYPILPPVHRSGPDLDQYTAVGLESGFGDDWLRFGGVKLFVDGHERGAARSEEMAGDVHHHRLPLLSRTYEQLLALVVQAMRAGIQLRMHAWGDFAQRQAIDAVVAAARATSRQDHRTRIEHMLNTGYSSIPLAEIREAGLVPVPQASFLVNDDPSASLTKYPFRDAIDAGVPFANSSDCTGSQPTLVSPWVGISAMLTRSNRNGDVIDPGQAVTLTEALRSYTSGSAYAAFEEEAKGTIEPGKLADLAVVASDPYAMAPPDLAGMTTDMTVIGGRIRFRRF